MNAESVKLCRSHAVFTELKVALGESACRDAAISFALHGLVR